MLSLLLVRDSFFEEGHFRGGPLEKHRIPFEILPQPNDVTCGPTCLEAVYRYYGDEAPLDSIIKEVPSLEGGGTLAVFLACHALRRGYRALIYTYNLTIFDPTWFSADGAFLPGARDRLMAQMKAKKSPKLETACAGYLEFLDMGGQIRLQDLSAALIRKYLNRSVPILTGLSSTFLYRSSREFGPQSNDDDIKGEPAGHFVVLCGYDRKAKNVRVADPLRSNPFGGAHYYDAHIDRVLCSILLGVITYDAKLLIIEPAKKRKKRA